VLEDRGVADGLATVLEDAGIPNVVRDFSQ